MKRILSAICAVLFLYLSFGCTAEKIPAPSGSIPEQEETAPIELSAKPLIISDSTADFQGITANYPKVFSSPSDDKINGLIYSTLSELAVSQGRNLKSLKYSVCHNDNGILSLLFEAEVKDSSGKRYAALTVNTVSGEKVPLSSNFKEGSAWEHLAEFYIAAAVRLKGTETYARLNVNNNKEYCLTGNKLLVLYETYEYTYYNGGDTLFSVPYSIFDGLCAEDGAIAAIYGEK